MISDAHIEFLSSPVAVQVAGRDSRNVAEVIRGTGCRVTPDRINVEIFLRAEQCPPLIAAVKLNGAIAVAFSRPSTHQTIQLKGSNARVSVARAEDRAVVEAHCAAFARELTSLGWPREFVTCALLPGWAEDVHVVTFTPDAVFEQTPGRNAGQQLTLAP